MDTARSPTEVAPAATDDDDWALLLPELETIPGQVKFR